MSHPSTKPSQSYVAFESDTNSIIKKFGSWIKLSSPRSSLHNVTLLHDGTQLLVQTVSLCRVVIYVESEFYRLPDSAFDLLDEACASAKVAQDMKPEAIDALDNDKIHILAHIKALEVSLCPF